MSRRVTLVMGLLASALAVGTTAASSRANLIDDTYGVGAGSFELGNYVANDNVSTDPYEDLTAGSTAITGWTVVGPNVDWLANPNHLAEDGTKSLDMQGNIGAGDCTIETVLPTVTGQAYNLSFYSYGGSLNQAQSGIINVGSLVNQTFTAPGTFDASTATYTHFSYNFTAVSTSTTLEFTSHDSNGFGPVIDNVSVDAVPEPASLGLLGLAGVGLLMRRSRRKIA